MLAILNNPSGLSSWATPKNSVILGDPLILCHPKYSVILSDPLILCHPERPPNTLSSWATP